MSQLEKKPTDIIRLQVRVRRDLVEALQKEADAEMLPVSAIVRRVLREHVARSESMSGAS